MKLDTHERAGAMADALVSPVIGVGEPRLPTRRQRLAVDRITVILRGDVAAIRSHLFARLVLAAMSELQLVGVAPCRQGENLVTEAHAEDGVFPFHRPPHVRDSLDTHLRVSGTV